MPSNATHVTTSILEKLVEGVYPWNVLFSFKILGCKFELLFNIHPHIAQHSFFKFMSLVHVAYVKILSVFMAETIICPRTFHQRSTSMTSSIKVC